jgi:hypothetical protein
VGDLAKKCIGVAPSQRAKGLIRPDVLKEAATWKNFEPSNRLGKPMRPAHFFDLRAALSWKAQGNLIPIELNVLL